MNQTNQIPQAQRSLKHFHAKGVLFAAEDLICQGIDLVHNTSLQQYFPACIKADIIEDLKKRKNVLVEPTGVNLSKDSLNPSYCYHRYRIFPATSLAVGQLPSPNVYSKTLGLSCEATLYWQCSMPS